LSGLDFEDLTIFEVSALSRQQLSISFEHPMEEAMATVELDLSDISNVTCRLYGPVNDTLNMAEFASKVVQRYTIVELKNHDRKTKLINITGVCLSPSQ